MRTSTISTPRDHDPLGHLPGEFSGDDVDRAAQRRAIAGRIVVGMGGRDVTQRRLGLDANEVVVIVDGIDRP
jgi:hypothetical protein